MANKIDLTGKEFTNLKVVDRAPNRITPKGQQRTTWNCICVCGKEFTAESQHIRKNLNMSCGCRNLKAPLKREELQSGEVYGRLTLTTGEYILDERRHISANCSCGNQNLTIRADSILDGNTQSCGCLLRERVAEANRTHGESHTTFYKNYHGMLQRCYNEQSKNYSNYGGRGIKVCDRWRDPEGGFLNFKQDMGEKPKGYSIERIDVNRDYCPENCIWENYSIQGFNRRKLDLNTSGRTGVYWYESRKRWVAKLMKDGKEKWIGQFINFEDACEAIEKSEVEMFGFSRTEYCFPTETDLE